MKKRPPHIRPMFSVVIAMSDRPGIPVGEVWMRLMYRGQAEDVVKRLREEDDVEAFIQEGTESHDCIGQKCVWCIASRQDFQPHELKRAAENLKHVRVLLRELRVAWREAATGRDLAGFHDPRVHTPMARARRAAREIGERRSLVLDALSYRAILRHNARPIEHPSLGSTVADVWIAWCELSSGPQSPEHLISGQIVPGPTFAWICGELARTFQQAGRGGAYVSTFRPATADEGAEILEAIQAGQFQVFMHKRWGATGMYARTDAGKVAQVLHQATGNPLP